MPRPQFSLKTLLWLMAGIGAVLGALVLYPPSTQLLAFLVAVAVIGACAGATKGPEHAILLAIFGFFLIGPFLIAAWLLSGGGRNY